MDEFNLIQKYFVPLSESFPDSLNLSDDAAILDIPEGQQLVVTKDAIAEGIHYLPGTDPKLIAQKLLRTNLSDLASMGATPLCYFLNIALLALDEEFIARFAEGLAADQKEFGIHLAGGDTITTKGAPVFSLTAHGLVPKDAALRRNGAKVGEAIYVSSTLGDAALGLQGIRHEALGMRDFLAMRYHLPEPRLELGIKLRGHATSCIDISDGLLADMGHVCKASHVGAEIYLEQLPLSDAAKKMLEESPNLWPLIYSGGDDYELLFTLPENATPAEGTTKIGKIIAGDGVKLVNNGVEIAVTKSGYSHS